MAPESDDRERGRVGCPRALEDVDLFSEGAPEHWYEAYEILHREAPVHRLPGEGLQPGSDGFILTRYEDVARVVRDPERFPTLFTLRLAQLEGLDPDAALERGNLMELSMSTLRPTQELYRRHRQELTDPWVGTGASRNRDLVARCVSELLDDWAPEEEGDFVRDFARPLPQRVMAGVLGFPREDVPRLEAWGDAQVLPFVHGRGHRMQISRDQRAWQREQLVGFQEYVLDQVARKRRSPGDDMTSFLCGVHYEALDRKLTNLEIAGIVYAMILGGLETTQYALVEQARLVCEAPELFQQLREDRSRLRAFLEEAMRLRSPTQGLSTRYTANDEVFQGVEVPAGSLLHLRFGAANVDAEAFSCPDQVDLERRAVTRHLAFSAGPRVCPGASLSRLEQQVAWDALLARLDGIAYAPGNDFLHQPGIMLGTLRLRVRFTWADAPR